MNLSLACGLTLAVLATSAQAADLRHHRRHGVPPSVDAVQLAGIAPPTRRGTALQTYGDAEIARALMQRRIPREDAANAAEVARTGGAPYPCDPRLATADAYVCRTAPGATGYKQFYAFTPSYVSAPTVFQQDPGTQAPVMPDITGFFWSVNSARLDPH